MSILDTETEKSYIFYIYFLITMNFEKTKQTKKYLLQQQKQEDTGLYNIYLSHRHWVSCTCCMTELWSSLVL